MYGVIVCYVESHCSLCKQVGLPMYHINLSASLLKMRPSFGIMRPCFLKVRPSSLDALVAE